MEDDIEKVFVYATDDDVNGVRASVDDFKEFLIYAMRSYTTL